MRRPYRSAIRFLFLLGGMVVAGIAFPNVAIEASDEEASTAPQTRQEILQSPRWTRAKQQLDEWWSVQSVYDQAQVQALKSELRNRIDLMTAEELNVFLDEMEAKVAALMSPASMDARRWLSKYTDKVQQEIIKEYRVEDPLRMPAADIESALRQFAVERQSKMASSAAFNRSRESQIRAAASYRQAQAKAARSVAATHRTPSGSPYTPRNRTRSPKTYSAA